MTARLRPRRLPRGFSSTVGSILAGLPDELPGGRRDERVGQWSVREAHATDTGIAVVKAGSSPGDAEVVVKLATAAPVGAQLQRHVAAVRALRADPRPGPWLRFVPDILAADEVDGMFYVVERAIGGLPASSVLAHDARRAVILEEALSTVASLHRLTASTVVVDEEILGRWIAAPVDALRRVGRSSGTLERIQGELREFLAGRSVEVSWVHGDYWPGNILIDGETGSPTGVVDWECAADGELAAHDLFHLLLFTRSVRERSDLGLLVRDLLRGRSSMDSERQQLERFVPPDDPQWFRTVLLLYWLRHLAAHLSQPATGTNQWIWVRRNVTPVLRVA
jgi:aminoglycoside phosphotransferase (APT) family kinase protein